MKNKFLLLLAATLLLPLSHAVAGTGDENLDPETKARIARFEAGPDKIDVSAYPPGIQADYRVFHEKCTLCHALSRPINSDYALPDEWSRYVKRMMNKPGSNISKVSGKKIYEFLVFDASVRKKALVEEKLSKLTPADRAAMVEKIEAIQKEYGGK